MCDEPIKELVEPPKPIIYFNTKPLDSLKDNNPDANLLSLLKPELPR